VHGRVSRTKRRDHEEHIRGLKGREGFSLGYALMALQAAAEDLFRIDAAQCCSQGIKPGRLAYGYVKRPALPLRYRFQGPE
jgi:hypothetical protein